MRYLALALYSEGPSDQGFLQRIVYRSVHEAAAGLASGSYEVQEQFVVGERYAERAPRAERIGAAFGRLIAAGAIHLLFIHADGGNDPDAARNDRVLPGRSRLVELCAGAAFEAVGIVPVRETEAWALVDRPALAAEFGLHGATLDTVLDATNVERIADPKGKLSEVEEMARRGRARRRRPGRLPIAPTLADRIAFAELRKLEAFRRFEADLAAALAAMWRGST